jgi:hypothetical protein
MCKHILTDNFIHHHQVSSFKDPDGLNRKVGRCEDCKCSWWIEEKDFQKLTTCPNDGKPYSKED